MQWQRHRFWAPAPPVLVVGGIFVGIGGGSFLAVDWALMTDIIPKSSSGRYMGISNVATATNGVVSGIIGGLIIDAFSRGGSPELGPRVAFLLAPIWFAIGALLLRPVDERRREGDAPLPEPLLDGSITPDGVVVARDDQLGTTLWRLTGPLSSRATIAGLYADANWSGRTATWQLLRCRPGTLTTAVHSDPGLFKTPQTVVAISGNRRAAVRFTPDARASLTIPVSPNERGTCIVRFVVTPTANPAEVVPGSTDDRVLGVHFDAFAYEPR